ncbi:MAG: enoyl-CoA hydratase/isomerase family protein [Chloroflexi bacterium]|nr:enoyl-CoA hydratase/isomerase family protein [Chloroflexota bacterium]
MSFVLYEVKDGIAWVTLNRPERLNAVDAEMRRRLRDIFLEIDDDDDVRVGVLTGAGERAFSSGFDLKEGPIPTAGQRGATGQDGRASPVAAILNLRKPTIAAIHGYCLAGSLDLALACDIRVAADDAVIGAPEMHWNLVDGYAAALLTRVVPLGHAMDLILRAQNVDATHALRIGLVNEVVPRNNLVPRCEEIAQQIAAQAPLAIRAMKELVYHSIHSNLEQVLAMERKQARLLGMTEDAKESRRAFLEKRPPTYHGR